MDASEINISMKTKSNKPQHCDEMQGSSASSPVSSTNKEDLSDRTKQQTNLISEESSQPYKYHQQSSRRQCSDVTEGSRHAVPASSSSSNEENYFTSASNAWNKDSSSGGDNNGNSINMSEKLVSKTKKTGNSKLKNYTSKKESWKNKSKNTVINESSKFKSSSSITSNTAKGEFVSNGEEEYEKRRLSVKFEAHSKDISASQPRKNSKVNEDEASRSSNDSETGKAEESEAGYAASNEDSGDQDGEGSSSPDYDDKQKEGWSSHHHHHHHHHHSSRNHNGIENELKAGQSHHKGSAPFPDSNTTSYSSDDSFLESSHSSSSAATEKAKQLSSKEQQSTEQLPQQQYPHESKNRLIDVNLNQVSKGVHQREEHQSSNNNALKKSISIFERSLRKGNARSGEDLSKQWQKQKKIKSPSQSQLLSGRKRAYKDSFLEANRMLTFSSNSNDEIKSSLSASLSGSKGRLKSFDNHEKSPIYYIGYDSMALILSYLHPQEVMEVITLPLSKSWQAIYTTPHDLWKIICSNDPFNATLDEAALIFGDSSDEDSLCSYPFISPTTKKVRHLFSKYRLLYSSFVKCVIYIDRLKEDVKKGVPAPSLGGNGPFPSGLLYLTRNINPASSNATTSNSEDSSSPNESNMVAANSSSSSSAEKYNAILNELSQNSPSESDLMTEAPRKLSKRKHKSKKLRIGRSQLTDRLLGRSSDGTGELDLPVSCAIYSIVNWMASFSDVQGIQIMCLKVIPLLLEDEGQRVTARRAGLTDIVLQEMVLFPENVALHTAAFHALVLLARPLGGREGELVHSAVNDVSGLFSPKSKSGKNGIAVMLDSMRRFSLDEKLQAMGCWSMVNIALIPFQKSMLVKLGGISTTLNAMIRHANSAEVQFRALFALINLVIPSEVIVSDTAAEEAEVVQSFLGSLNDVSEEEILDEHVSQIVNLVTISMKNFYSCEAIMNRCCLVLHNLGLYENYHTTLLWTPNCYQMLEWALANYRNDNVLQQSAGKTLQRLQLTLSNDSDLRSRFAAAVRAQNELR